MTTTEAYGELRRLGVDLFTSREAAARLKTSVSNASHRLRAMERAGLILSVRRGLWAIRTDVDPLVVPPFLTAPYPAYVSFWSALARHGMIEQIPRRTYVATSGRSQKLRTSVGEFSIHHLLPEIFDGFTGGQQRGFIATPEKALFDVVYLRASRALPVHLPEVDLTPGFDAAKLIEWVDRLPTARLRTLTAKGLETVLRRVAAARVLDAPDMPVPELDALRAELDARDR